MSIFEDCEVEEIYTQYYEEGKKQMDIAEIWGVSQSCISSIIRHDTYTHVLNPHANMGVEEWRKNRYGERQRQYGMGHRRKSRTTVTKEIAEIILEERYIERKPTAEIAQDWNVSRTTVQRILSRVLHPDAKNPLDDLPKSDLFCD